MFQSDRRASFQNQLVTLQGCNKNKHCTQYGSTLLLCAADRQKQTQRCWTWGEFSSGHVSPCSLSSVSKRWAMMITYQTSPTALARLRLCGCVSCYTRPSLRVQRRWQKVNIKPESRTGTFAKYLQRVLSSRKRQINLVFSLENVILLQHKKIKYTK